MRPTDHTRGFTLIEVLAALLIFSISIIGLTHARTQSIKAVSVIDEKNLAGVIADNALIRARMRPLRAGTQSGETVQMGQRFNYSLITQETSVKDFYRITVTVNREGNDYIILSRDAYRGPS